MAKKLTSKKAREILHDKSVHGHPLTDKQRRFFGAVASGYIKAQDGGNVPSEEEWLNQQFVDNLTFDPRSYQLPSRIQDAARRDQQIKDLFYSQLDQTKNPYLSEAALRAANQGYGSDRIPNTKLQNYYGFDYGDIDRNKLIGWYDEYQKQLDQKKNGGWLDKYNAPQAQNGIEGTMGGLTDKGFNYNGAWGGPSMQDGGNLQPPMAGANQNVPMYQLGGNIYSAPIAQTGREVSTLYVSDADDPRYKSYTDSLYSYNVGQRLNNILSADKNYIGVRSGSPLDRQIQEAAKKTNKGLIDNTKGVSNKKVEEVMKEYQQKANKGILPIRYQGYIPNPDNAITDLLTGRSFLEMVGLTEPKAAGSWYLPQWKKPQVQVVVDQNKAPKSAIVNEYKTPDGVTHRYIGLVPPQKQSKKESSPIYTSDPNDPRIKAYQDSLGLYNLTKGDINRIKNMSPEDWWKYTDNFYKSEKGKKAKDAYASLTKYNKTSPKPIKTFSPREGDEAIEFKKPVQPVEYRKPESIKFEKKLKDREPSKNIITREHPEVETKLLKNLPYRVEYRDEQGKPTHTYFENEAAAKEFWESTPGEKTGYYDRKLAMGGNIAQDGKKIDEVAFQEFFRTLPNNLRVDSPEYNLRGYWDALGRPKAFNYSQPKEEDGFYHAFSRHPETGEILKRPQHPTFKMAIEEDRKSGYFPIVTPEGKVKTVSGSELKRGESVFAQGGSIPGSVGFTYARTGAPSEGPHAKKTMPSAQNGMSFYQHGLDWKPRTISQNGSETSLFEQIPSIPSALFKTLMNPVGIGEAMATGIKNIFTEKPSDFDYDAEYNKANTYMSRPIFKGTELKPKHIAKGVEKLYEKTGYKMPVEFVLTQGQLETKLGKELKSKNNYFNVGNFDDGRVKNYEDPQESVDEYVNLLYNDYLQKGKKDINDLIKPKGYVNYRNDRYASDPNYETNFKQQLDFIRKFVNAQKKRNGGWLDKYEVPEAQTGGQYGFDDVRELARQNISSSTDAQTLAQIKAAADAVELAKLNEMRRKQGEIKKAQPERSAASKALAIATNPVTALSYKVKGQDIPEYFERGEVNPYENALNMINPAGYINAAASIPGNISRGEYLQAGLNTASILPILYELKGLRTTAPKFISSEPVITRGPIEWYESIKKQYPGATHEQLSRIPFNTLKNNLGTTDLSFFEKHPELAPYITPEEPIISSGFTKSLENIDPELSSRLKLRNKLLKDYWFNKRNKKEGGSVIKDNRGQWAHPGEITEIGSNRITMKGVPYPVLGVSDEGDTQMMYPEKEYKFKGKKVTEYPVTNWLDKYK